MAKSFGDKIEKFIESMGIFGSATEKILLSGFIIVTAIIIMKIILHIVRKVMDKTSVEKVLYTFVENFIKVLFWIMIIVTILGILGVPTTTFVTVIGACGAAIALALRESLANFAGGILIILNKPFATDDLIEMVEISNTLGRVKRIDLLYSILTTPDNRVITVPNGLLTNHVVINHSRADRRRVDCQFHIDYTSDIDRAREVISRIINENPIFLTDPESVIGVSAHGDNAIVIDVFVWCNTDDYYTGKYYLMEKVKLAFDEEGIEIPYPHLKVQCDGKSSDKIKKGAEYVDK